jgi:putative Holliday junction resolvase
LTAEPGRVLAIDLGSARVGLALSDPLRITGQPMGHLPRRGARAQVDEIARIVGENEVAVVVVGHPILMSGRAGEAAREAEAFTAKLRGSLGCPVVLWDERLTTAQAQRALIAADVRRRRRREVVDAAAAALILQSWLDANPSR